VNNNNEAEAASKEEVVAKVVEADVEGHNVEVHGPHPPWPHNQK
jgi:hypothetical protein